MNYLAHHFVARRAEPKAARPAFFVGNILPDLMAQDGDGGHRLRPKHAASDTPDADLARGARLHFATDRRFHTHPDFAAAMTEAADALRPVLPPSAGGPPPRLFFLAHVAVELALDAFLLRADPALADHLYGQLDAADTGAVARTAARMRGQTEISTTLAVTQERFREARYLYDYATDAGLALSLHRICRRANLPGFPAEADRANLTEAFAFIVSGLVSTRSGALLIPPERSAWYNSPAKDEERSDPGHAVGDH